MKKTFKAITAVFSAVLMLSGTCMSVSAENVQPRGSWYMYGDVNNDGSINMSDVVLVNKAVNIYDELTGDVKLPVSYAVSRPAVYFPTVATPVPQAADVNGDGFISTEDSAMIQRAIVHLDDTGRCGQPFYVN
ncbi:MAG: dockerin type I repeat-containing protein [Oscillospiraceae bacterium]|nr:dockerin type I repeat-containing protein [Oscillospiraceae bacterium]